MIPMKLLIGIFLIGIFSTVDSLSCNFLGDYYYEWEGSNLSIISNITQPPIPRILAYSRPNQEVVLSDTQINVPFRCDCHAGDEYLAHVFTYTTSPSVTYEVIRGTYYANLTAPQWKDRNISNFPKWNIDIPFLMALNVPVNCSCVDRSVWADYGLFLTYPLRAGDSMRSFVAANFTRADFVKIHSACREYSVEFPDSCPYDCRDFPPKSTRKSDLGLIFRTPGSYIGTIAGISVVGIAGVLLFAGCLYVRRKKNVKKIQFLSTVPENDLQQLPEAVQLIVKAPDSAGTGFGAPPGLRGITVDTSIEFSYKELANATNDFSIAHKIGEGGFGAVYYAELRGEKAAIKKMDMRASKEFLAELKVLTHVHHLHLVHLIGYCVQRSLFLVYEYIDNGNLSEHLRCSGREPLSWSTRMQIALDSARGLEYIHEHTVSVYVHRDIKPANILIDKNFHAKVADFGLTKLTEVGNGTSLPTDRLVGTFGYMPPEYAQYLEVSPKVDVYAFGVVLYELISAKEAVVKTNGSPAEPRSLVDLFEEALGKPDPAEELSKLIDPRVGDGYSLDLVQKMAQLAQICTHENPQLRPSMKSIVVTLMALSSSVADLDVGSF